MGNVQDGLPVRIQNLRQGVQITALVKMIAYPQGFQMPVPVQLVIIRIHYPAEPGFIFRQQNGHIVPAEVGARHGQHMGVRFPHHVMQKSAQPAAFTVRGHMVKFIYPQQAAAERFRSQLFKREAQRGMRANQDAGLALHKLHKTGHLAGIRSGRAQVVAQVRRPVREKSAFRQPYGRERTANRPFRHSHNHLAQPLPFQLIQSQIHQRAALAGCRRRL